ncbi:5-amino-6-(5-phosphoribosylamino)uracil reductase [Salinarchaeum sp. Harcht-Bsk1]|uniref:2,5-diamino-6-(ribosylamino)-4(3H)-pyrimidinone 5'-phosphate reductase n=1 Tax=Salinarchaeum sp. Harcht-Bsk1 TaxID=1333523 RepID=UPI000342282E|nr:2,5-diamino-6-(ribosylamino)-4(3H)-pyrimidinone 5'-phosphate reductase [Salinarchaeum sp. Harcht-Bsk1]AGN01374.1 5-amino-6-(5-phosphoribosylamino)uracil reductase [Salinarchaeum sp. Harcht-Bsk1]
MHVRVNAAVSADGKLSNRHREQVPISGPADFERVDRIRAEFDAVLVGVGTVLADDPSLTVDDPDLRAEREGHGEPVNPARVVADSRARTPTDARILDDEATTYVLVSEAAPADRRRGLEAAGAELVVADASGAGDDADAGDQRVDLPAAFEQLESVHGVDSLMIEGGGELLYSCFEAGLVDELTLYVGSTIIGGRDAPTLVDGEGFVAEFVDLELRDVERVDDGVLVTWAVSSPAE